MNKDVIGKRVKLKSYVNLVDNENVHHYVYKILDNVTSDEIGSVMLYKPEEIDKFLYCGNVGMKIKEEYQGKGYATEAFELAKEILKELGFEKVIMTCEINNINSYKNLSNHVGAKYIGRKKVPEDDSMYSDDFKEVEIFEKEI